MTASDAREGTLRGLAGSERAQGGAGLYGAPVGSRLDEIAGRLEAVRARVAEDHEDLRRWPTRLLSVTQHDRQVLARHCGALLGVVREVAELDRESATYGHEEFGEFKRRLRRALAPLTETTEGETDEG